MDLIKKSAFVALFAFISQGLTADIEVLDQAAIPSKLAESSLLIDLIEYNDEITAVGERGHIINWQAPGQWQQEEVPVSVLLTAVTALSDGTRIAIGHDSAIIISKPDSDQWQKVFDGYDLLDLKVTFFEQQIQKLQETIDNTEDEDLLDELSFQLEELTFSLEDTQVEKEEGPNKPLLSITATADDQVFVTGSYGTLLYSNDKGQSWVLQDDKVDNLDKFHLNSIISSDNNRLYIVGESGSGFASTDNGVSWIRMEMPYQGSLFGIAAQENSDNLVAYGLQGNLMSSNDGGRSWRSTRIDTSGSFQGGAISADGRAFVVGHGGLVVDFNVDSLDEINVRKHPSGAAFAKPLIDDDTLVLVGQYGIITWSLNNQ